MANLPRHIDLAVAESMETKAAARQLIEMLDAAQADGVITLDEADDIYSQALEVLREAKENVLAVERANIAELVMAATLKHGEISPYLLKQARDVGLQVAIPIMDVSAPADLRKTA